MPEAQAEVKRQFPPVPHEVLEQHLMSAASLGQAPETVVPPPLVQVAVAIQTPGVPEEVEQGPLTAAWAPTRRTEVMRRWNCMIGEGYWEWVVKLGSAGRRRFICQLAFSEMATEKTS